MAMLLSVKVLSEKDFEKIWKFWLGFQSNFCILVVLPFQKKNPFIVFYLSTRLRRSQIEGNISFFIWYSCLYHLTGQKLCTLLTKPLVKIPQLPKFISTVWNSVKTHPKVFAGKQRSSCIRNSDSTSSCIWISYLEAANTSLVQRS